MPEDPEEQGAPQRVPALVPSGPSPSRGSPARTAHLPPYPRLRVNKNGHGHGHRCSSSAAPSLSHSQLVGMLSPCHTVTRLGGVLRIFRVGRPPPQSTLGTFSSPQKDTPLHSPPSTPWQSMDFPGLDIPRLWNPPPRDLVSGCWHSVSWFQDSSVSVLHSSSSLGWTPLHAPTTCSSSEGLSTLGSFTFWLQ